MASETFYTLYRAIPGRKTTFKKDRVVRRYAAERESSLFGDLSRFRWEDVPPVIPMSKIRPESTDFTCDNPCGSQYVLKSTGDMLNCVGYWSFISTSVFVLDLIDANKNSCYEQLVSPSVARQFVEAVDFASVCKDHKLDRGSYVMKMRHDNFILDRLFREGYAPLPSTLGKVEDDLDAEWTLLSVKSIFEAYLTLCSSEPTDSDVILTVQHSY